MSKISEKTFGKCCFKAVLVALTFIAFNSCKKSDSKIQSVPTNKYIFVTSKEVDSLRNNFALNNYEQKFVENLNSSVKVQWEPVWDNAGIIKKLSGDLVYFFVPVQGKNLISKAKVEVQKAKNTCFWFVKGKKILSF